MTKFASEEDFLEDRIEVLKEAIDYLSKSICKAERDISPDIYGVHDEVCEQLENGILALKGKLFEAQERLKERDT